MRAGCVEMVGLTQRLAELSPGQRAEFSRRLDAEARTLMSEPVAVVGIGCRLPGGALSPDLYWEMLTRGADAVGSVPSGRWPHSGADGWDEVRGDLSTGGFLGDIAGFDASFFDISPREAAAMDPQQRLLLEVAWEALEHAGIPPSDLGGTRTGVFVGVSYTDYLGEGLASPETIDAYTITGGIHSVGVGRLSYTLDLRGPSVALDTACSSSLVAVHQACASLRTRESDSAIAGGVNLLVSPETTYSLARYGLLSEQGRCSTFDASADGIVRSEGCGMVMLKRFADALRDGDRVLAVIRGSAVNQDGHSNGLTAPSGTAQLALLREALDRAGTAPETVGLVETHGTGTRLGDPIEAEALAEVYGRGDLGGCALGAVKTNLGHLEAASGVAGLIKAVLAVQRGQVPPNLHLRRTNPDLGVEGGRLFLPTDTVDWPVPDRERIAAVSSFGIGGTNAHVIVEQAPDMGASTSTEDASGSPMLLVASAASGTALARTAERHARSVRERGHRLGDLAHTLHRRRSHLRERFATVVSSAGEFADRLDALAGGSVPESSVRGRVSDTARNGLVWVFSGHGSQWAGMGREALRDPVFRAAVAEIAPVYQEELGISLLDALAEPDLPEGADQVQPLIFATQIGLAAMWVDLGVRPAAVVGSSMGEIAAAVAAGALTGVDGARLMCRRSRLLRRVSGEGGMALVTLSAEETSARLRAHPGLSVAIHSSARSTVVSGPAEAVERFVAENRGEDFLTRRIASDVAFHSPAMGPLAEELTGLLADVDFHRPRVPMFAAAIPDTPVDLVPDAHYWGANLENPVRFTEAVSRAVQRGFTAFVEIAPHPVVRQSVEETLAEAGVDGVVAVSSRRHEAPRPRLTLELGRLYCAGAPVEHALTGDQGALVDLPTNPWEHRSHWHKLVPRAERTTGTAAGDASASWTHRLEWVPAPHGAPAVDAVPAVARNWLVLADRGGVGDAFADLVRGEGGACALVAPGDDASDPGFAATDVLDCTGLDLVHAGLADTEALDTRVMDAVIRSRPVAGRPSVRQWFVTRDAQLPGPDGGMNVLQSALWGLGRGIAIEHPEAWGGVVDVGDAAPSVSAERVLHEVTAVEDQVAYVGDERRVPRLVSADPPPETASDRPLSPEGAHLAIGANGTIGPYLVPQLVALGARHLVLVSRRGLTGSVADAVDRARAAGVGVTEVAADVTDESAMTALFKRFGNDLPPLKGVFNLAFAGRLVDLADMTADEVRAMLAPKVTGSLILDKLSRGHDIDQFVLFSSISALLSSRGMAHYAAASCVLDALGSARRAEGLPALVVNWGAWRTWVDDVAGDYQNLLAGAGFAPMDDRTAVELLGRLLHQPSTQWVVVDAEWDRLADAYRTRSPMHVLDLLAPPDEDPASTPGAPAFAERLAGASARQRRALVRDLVRTVVAGVLGHEHPHELALGAPFFENGMDSLMSVQVQREINTRAAVRLLPADIFDHPTVNALSEWVLEKTEHTLSTGVEAPDGDTNGDANATPDDAHTRMSDRELLERLAERSGYTS